MNQARVRVLIVSERFEPAYAGPAIRFRRYARGLSARDIDVTVFTRSHGMQECGAPYTAPESLMEDELDGIPVVRFVPDETLGEPHVRRRFERALVRFCRDRGRDFDVVQVLTAISPPSTRWIVPLRRARLPLVYTHTMMAERSTNVLKRALQVPYWSLPFNLLDRIVVSSGVMKRGLLEIGVRRPVEVIPNGVDLVRFRPEESESARSALRAELGIEPGDEVVLFVGSLSPRKGIDLLASAWRLIAARRPRARLFLVGPRRDEIRPEEDVSDFLAVVFREVGDDLRTGKVVATGSVRDVERFMRAADVFVFPSRREGMPNVVPEAFASGLATVMTPFLGLPEEFGRAGWHYVLAERDARGIGDSVVSLLENASVRLAMGDRARALVEATMAVEASLDRYVGLYREVAGKRNLPRSG